jgi:two-component system, NtrC family, response regulator AtoC
VKFKILIIDDDDLVCASLKKVLEKFGYEVRNCMDGAEAIDTVKNFQPDIIFLDIYLKEHNGLDILKELQRKFFDIPVIMITGYSDVKIAVTAIKSGAYDFLLKPLEIDQLKLVLDRALKNLTLRNEVEKLHQLLQGDFLTREFFGRSKQIQKLLQSAEKLAASSDTTVLIEGESGTGKEGFAKYIHQCSPRKNNNFIQINCAAIPKELAESELFGHEKGAFTGAAQKTKLGKFELANGGTILLDELGELSLDLQVKLLRVLQEKKFYRVGGEKEVLVDVRVLAATNKNLDDEVNKGSFREDLFYRLNVARLLIPPLRDRKEDIPVLAYTFLNEFSSKFGKRIKGINDSALEILEKYNWKGNIRELKNVMERAVLLMDGDELNENHLSFVKDSVDHLKPGDNDFVLKIPSKGIKIDIVLRSLIQKTLNITQGNQVKAAKILGLSRSKLRYRMEQLGIEVTKNVQ